jgi:multidrug resistance efflux pump
MDQASPPLLSSGPPGPLAAQDAILRCQAALLSRSGLAQSATALAVELAQLLSCHRVSIAMGEGDRLRIVGSTQAAEPDPRHETAVAIVAAMHEATDQRLSVAWPATVSSPPISLAHRQLAGSGQACSVPVMSGGKIAGAITFERPAGEMFWPAQVALCEDIASFVGPVLELKRAAERPWHGRIAAAVRSGFAAPSRRRTAWAVGLVVAALLLALPLPWRVSAPARLEGSVQRAVVAAADGFLQQANVRPGDRVVAGQVLAQLSAQDLELERKRRESELRQHEGSYRAAQARNDRTQMVISQSKAAETQALLTLAETQLDRSKLQAPFDGIVIKGDLSQTLGAPVQRGEVLMVLAPNDSFRLIVEVDETDIAAIHPGQKGQLALAARPEQPLAFSVRRIVPVATAADGRNYFEVEATPDQAQADLRPGLSGIAKIEVGERSLGWLLFHRAVAWLRLSLWTVAL